MLSVLPGGVHPIVTVAPVASSDATSVRPPEGEVWMYADLSERVAGNDFEEEDEDDPPPPQPVASAIAQRRVSTSVVVVRIGASFVRQDGTHEHVASRAAADSITRHESDGWG